MRTRGVRRIATHCTICGHPLRKTEQKLLAVYYDIDASNYNIATHYHAGYCETHRTWLMGVLQEERDKHAGTTMERGYEGSNEATAPGAVGAAEGQGAAPPGDG